MGELSNCSHDVRTDSNRSQIVSNIKEFGCHIVYVEGSNYLPDFAYTIGLFEKFHCPEIICFGLKREVLGAVLNHACNLVRSGERFVVGQNYDSFLNEYAVQFLNVDKAYYRNYIGYGLWYYDKLNDIPLQQLVWPDKEHEFPWDENFNEDWKFKQPLLDRNIDFKFYEQRNLAVFTTKQVIEGNPILYVYHDLDGDWQFHSEEAPLIDDTKLVCLEEITRLDLSINEIFDLQLGWQASRKSIDGEWQTEAYQEEDS